MSNKKIYNFILSIYYIMKKTGNYTRFVLA